MFHMQAILLAVLLGDLKYADKLSSCINEKYTAVKSFICRSQWMNAHLKALRMICKYVYMCWLSDSVEPLFFQWFPSIDNSEPVDNSAMGVGKQFTELTSVKFYGKITISWTKWLKCCFSNCYLMLLICCNSMVKLVIASSLWWPRFDYLSFISSIIPAMI